MLAIVTIVLGLLPGLFKAIPGIPAGIAQIIADISASVTAVLGSGALTQPAANTILMAWAGVITALKADPNLPASSLAAVAQLEKIVQAAPESAFDHFGGYIVATQSHTMFDATNG